ncbi:hypothetical protein PHJA_001978300 [Phtheirospermum japonicum]|uniref:Uncharacterized protein n=1 Tax=Phtheirospermum japonicum TaxID=374723 RepID=A0A830CQE1_9LAMI|nr:hypothetical protein PHJA_001978300 [Phtheirospermum japonicum]
MWHTPTNHSSTPTTTSRHRNSPLPYFFAGLGFMLLLFTAALIVLTCSYWKCQTRPSNNDGEEAAQHSSPVDDDNTPVVIMVGDHNPTHLAIPIKV